MSSTDPSSVFDEITELDSTALFKPRVVSLVVTDSAETGPNIMTASWLMFAGYDPFRYLLAVSHKTHTYEILQENPEFVLAAPTTEMRDALALAGTVSGRDVDKIDHLGLETVPGSEVDVPLLRDAIGNIECAVLDSFEFGNCTYYFGGVEAAYVTAGGLDGRILSLEEDILAYMGSNWGDDSVDTKYRYYAELAPDDLERFPDDAALEELPPAVREN